MVLAGSTFRGVMDMDLMKELFTEEWLGSRDQSGDGTHTQGLAGVGSLYIPRPKGAGGIGLMEPWEAGRGMQPCLYCQTLTQQGENREGEWNQYPDLLLLLLSQLLPLLPID